METVAEARANKQPGRKRIVTRPFEALAASLPPDTRQHHSICVLAGSQLSSLPNGTYPSQERGKQDPPAAA